MTRRIGWQASVLAVAALVVAAVVIDVATGINAIAATARVVWNALVFATLWTARSVQGMVALIARRRAWRLTSFVTSIGFGYSGRVFLSEGHSRKVRTWRNRSRAAVARVRRRWLALPTAHKFAVVAILIALQLFLLPTVSEYILLFPVGFMIPLIVLGARKAYTWVGDLMFAKVYWKYCGKTHQVVMRRCNRLMPVRAVAGVSRLARLQYLTAWRLWKYEPRYRDESGELWISVFEPFRLWWGRKLDIYIGNPLLAGERPDAPRIAPRAATGAEAPAQTPAETTPARRALVAADGARQQSGRASSGLTPDRA